MAEKKTETRAEQLERVRSQETVEDTLDYQLLMSTPVQLIVALTGKTEEEVRARAKTLGAKPVEVVADAKEE